MDYKGYNKINFSFQVFVCGQKYKVRKKKRDIHMRIKKEIKWKWKRPNKLKVSNKHLTNINRF